ncbi:alpha-2,8-polysialyltransferase family protein [Marinobacter arenosus]|uniref:alpha-2,8-polysialyltransferase family protein n=1 Tax=Marinobacter arenosus TaxID=2856822 RepID=UPI001C4BD6E6|nr:alpha-2,8-polysialyltransferase family protein [Marinobacter arenosus]MBW0146820.1 alpha-2,8-polysialyltransferase family protein [Marinobacter arenosus]
MSVINLVVGFTPYHSLYAESFLGELNGKTYCFFSKRHPDISSFPQVKMIGSRKSSLLSIFIYSIYVRFWLLRKFKINLYCPHPCNIAVNYLFFSGRCSSVTVYEDGVANYYDASRSEWTLPLYKTVLSALLLMPFRSYAGHITGCDEMFVDRLFVSRPKSIVKSSRFRRVCHFGLKLKVGKSVGKKGKILFLDQPVQIPDDQKEERVKLAFGQLKPGVEVHYKPHHDSVSDFDFMKKLPSSKAKMPAEQLVAVDDFSVVVSFYSSALLNISTIFKNVRCYYIVADEKMIEVDGKAIRIYDFLEHYGISPLHGSELFDDS